MDSALSVRDLSLNIGGAKILDGITLEVAHNETLGIIGPNGAAKTSFFNILSGIRKPSRGQIFVGDTDVTDLPPHERALSGIARTFQTSSVFISFLRLLHLPTNAWQRLDYQRVHYNAQVHCHMEISDV